jgi:hypothetical protein
MAREFPPYVPPLFPDVIPPAHWRRNDKDTENANAEFKEKRLDIINRDKKTCWYCRISTQRPGNTDGDGGGLHVHHLNGDHSENKDTNLLTVCPLCHAVFHLGFHSRRGSGSFKKAISIIRFPWLRQGELNILVWGIALAYHRRQLARKDDPEFEGAVEFGKRAEELDFIIKKAGSFPDDFFPPAGNDSKKTPIGAAMDPLTWSSALTRLKREAPEIYKDRAILFSDIKVYFNYRELHTSFGTMLDRFGGAVSWHPGNKWPKIWEEEAAKAVDKVETL